MYVKPQEMLKILDGCSYAYSVYTGMLPFYREWRKMLCDKIDEKCTLYVYGKVNGVLVQRLMPLSYYPESKEEETELAHRCLRRGMERAPHTSLLDVRIIEKGDTVPVLSDEQLHACIELS